MSNQYQQADKDFVDYNLSLHAGFPLPIRDGAGLSPTAKNVSFIGAAQTFGRFALYPFPHLLQQPLGIKSINLGFAGAGPMFFINHQYLIDLANSTDAVVIQIMSGRSVQNKLMGYMDGFWKGSSTMISRETGSKLFAEDAWERLAKQGDEASLMELIQETRENYIEEYRQLLQLIRKPKILLWFSVASPDRDSTLSSSREFNDIAGPYPHFITRSEVNAIKSHVDHYCEVACNTGLPQQLFHKTTQEPMNRTPGDFRSASTFNEYYPSPEMHWCCALNLAPVLQSVLTAL